MAVVSFIWVAICIHRTIAPKQRVEGWLPRFLSPGGVSHRNWVEEPCRVKLKRKQRESKVVKVPRIHSSDSKSRICWTVKKRERKRRDGRERENEREGVGRGDRGREK